MSQTGTFFYEKVIVTEEHTITAGVWEVKMVLECQREVL